METIQNSIKHARGALIILFAVALSACGSSSSSSWPTSNNDGEDVATLTVTSTAPTNQALDVATNTKVIALFNEEMNAGTIDGSSFLLQGESESSIVGAVSYNPDTLTATLQLGDSHPFPGIVRWSSTTRIA